MVSVASIFGVLCILVGGILLVRLLFMRHLAIASRSWPMVAGRITASRKEIVRDEDGDMSYYPIVEYDYVVAGQACTSSIIKFSLEKDSEVVADHILGRYSPGTMVSVYHHPRKPRLSVLEPGGFSHVDLVYFLFSLFFLAVGVIFIRQ